MRVLVTGGGGFLGEAITRKMLARGERVRIFARGSYPALAALGAEVFQGDLRNAEEVSKAAAGMDAVIHTAAKAGVWGTQAEYYGINVQGTRNVIDACKQNAIQYLVFTSSPSVVLTGKDIEGGDESLPYSRHFLSWYPPTKAEAERLVKAANGPNLRTVGLRPHLIWGPGDPHILPRLSKQARAGKLRRIGTGDPLVDCVYVDNAADAHLNALDKLIDGADIGGRVYFITNGEPIGCWTIINQMLEASGAPPVTGTIPRWLAMTVATILENVWKALGKEQEPRITRFVVSEMSCAHWFRIDAARRDLGYVPRISLEDGLRRLREASVRNGHPVQD